MPRQPIFAIFEGGGAKGVAHVGAVAAAESLKLRLMGVAGASAGALVATLVAAGLRAKDILDPEDPGANIIHRNGMTVPGLLGAADWRRFNRLRRRRNRLAFAVAIGGLAGMLTAPRAALAAFHIYERRGRLSTDTLRTFLNDRLCEQVAAVRGKAGHDGSRPERVTFRDLDYETYEEFLPLKIVATDLTRRELRIFSQATTPDVEVAQAVAASVAIPVVFKPVELELLGSAGEYVDGGLVSNLPVWIFANEKLAVERAYFRKPPIPIVAFTLKDTALRPAKKDLLGFLQDVGEVALAGSQSISQAFMQDLTVVQLPCSLEMLAFDASEDRMLEAYQSGYEAARITLRRQLLVKPQLVRDELGRIYGRVRPALNAFLAGKVKPRWLLRASIIEPVGEDAFRVTYGHNMDNDADDRLPIDGRGRASPAAFKSRDMQFAPFGRRWREPERDYMTKYERALAHPKMRSIIAVPIFEDAAAWELPADERPQPCGVFAIDSDQDLAAAFDDTEIFKLLATQSTLLYPLLTQEPSLG